MSNDFHIFDSTDYNQLIFSESPFQQMIKEWMLPYVINGTSKYIANVDAEVNLICAGELILPITINESIKNSYIANPYNYIAYGYDELIAIRSPLLRFLLFIMLCIFDPLLRLGKIHKNVMVNNWLVSTNLYPDITKSEIQSITTGLTNKFNNKAIIWRSLNSYHHQELINHFQSLGYIMIPSRQVYIYDPKIQPNFSQHRQLKEDARATRQNSSRLFFNLTLNDNQISQIQELYNQLYITKYSQNNPRYTFDFFRLAAKHRFMNFITIGNQEIEAVAGYFQVGSIFTTPIVGINATQNKKHRLYRTLSLERIKIVQNAQLTMNDSSGAGEFKRNRGAIAQVEYSAVYIKHLPLNQKLVWGIFGFLIRHIALPIVRRLGL